MVVKDFGSVEVNFTGEQHAHDQGMHPVPCAGIFSSVSPWQFGAFLLWIQIVRLAWTIIYHTH